MKANMSHLIKHSLMSPPGLKVMGVIAMQSVPCSTVIIIEVTVVGFAPSRSLSKSDLYGLSLCGIQDMDECTYEKVLLGATDAEF